MLQAPRAVADELIDNRYRLVEIIGQGGVGVVHKAVDRLNGETVALKRITLPEAPGSSRGEDSQLRLASAQEFQFLASLRHPHIVAVLDFGFDAIGAPYLTMEYLPGAQPIVEYGYDQPLEVQVQVLIQMLQAIAYLHRRRILHRDLKPDNVLVIDGAVKLLDFGLATAIERGGGEMVQGTPAYLAPEILQGQAVSPAADLYAVGVIAYELFAGRHPFDTRSMNRFLLSALRDEPDLNALAIPVSIRQIVARLLAKSPAKRYQQAGPVIQQLSRATGLPRAREPAAIRESYLQAATFVGRQAQLDQLLKAMNRAVEGQGSAFLVAGESGIGKSRLLAELRVRAQAAGHLVLSGQAPRNAGLPYQIWRAVLPRLILAAGISDLEAAILKPAVSNLQQLLGRDIPEAPPMEGKAELTRLIGTILSLFQRLSRPCLFLAEDLQWALEDLAPFKALVNLAGELPLLVVGDYRDDERPDLPAELPAARLIKLDRLQEDEVGRLSVAMLGRGGRRPEVINLLQKESEGNAFFLVEVIRALAEESGRLSDIATMTLPEHVVAGGVTRIVERRLAQAPAEARPMLELAAVAGRYLDLAVLAKLADARSGWPSAAALDEWLGLGANAAVLEVSAGQWRFSHDKLREGLLAGIPDQERPILHGQVAAALEAVYPDDMTLAPVLAEHWHAAGDEAKESYWAPTAMEYLLASSSFGSAQKIGQRALKSAGLQAGARLRIHLSLGTLFGPLGQFQAAESHLDQSWVIAESIDDQPALANIAVRRSRVALTQGRLQEAEKLVEQAAELYRALGDEIGRASAIHVKALLASNRGQFRRAGEIHQGNLALRQELGDRLGVAETLRALGATGTYLGDYDEAERYFGRSLVVYQETGDRFKEGIMLMNLGAVAARRGADSQARSYYKRSLAIARSIGHQTGVAMNLNNLAVLEARNDQLLKAERHLQEALRLSQLASDHFNTAFSLRCLGDVQLRRGDAPRATAYLTEALRVAWSIRARSLILEILLAYAQGQLDMGRAARSARLLGLIEGDPGLDAGNREPFVEPLRLALERTLEPQTLAENIEAGQALDLETVVQELLANRPDATSQIIYHVNQ